jgi:hypothetical protein
MGNYVSVNQPDLANFLSADSGMAGTATREGPRTTPMLTAGRFYALAEPSCPDAATTQAITIAST